MGWGGMGCDAMEIRGDKTGWSACLHLEGMVWYGMVWYGTVWCGVVWYDLAWGGIGLACRAMPWLGVAWRGVCGVEWRGAVR